MKKAISHIEIILSFVIFVGFLIVILAIFNPFKAADGSRTSLDILERGIKNYANVEVASVTIKLNVLENGCFYFDSNLSNIVVRDKNNNFAEGYYNDGKIYILGEDDFYHIYSSEEFSERTFSGSCHEIFDYKLGIAENYNFISNVSLINFVKEYNQEYEKLKNKIGMTNDFSFNIQETGGDMLLSVSKTIPKNVRVIARDIPIQIVYSTGEFKTAILNIRTW
jgi:hypothetical protein